MVAGADHPALRHPGDPDAARRLSSAASVSPEFIELTNVAISNEEAFVRRKRATPAEVRDLVGYADSYDRSPTSSRRLRTRVARRARTYNYSIGGLKL